MTSVLLNELKTIFPEIKMEIDANDANYAKGEVLFFPITEEEIAQIVKYCNEQNKTITITAGDTKSGYGNPTEMTDVQISLIEYTGIVEHIVGDMTITVRAGTRFKTLQDYLAKYHQKIALDPSWGEVATIGGIIAANDSGPKRLGYGTARDSVIGLKMIYPDGKNIRTGGKVVKNVAGYDMNKLFIGSMGTLGIISEITLKLRPLKKHESLILLSFPEGDMDDIRSFTTKLLDSMMEPVAIELLNPALAKELTLVDAYTIAISFEDVERSVRYQEQFVKQIQPTRSKMTVLEEDKAREFWNQFYTLAPNGSKANLEKSERTEAAIKTGVVNLDVLKIIRECQIYADSQKIVAYGHGGLGTGICQLLFQGSSEDVRKAIDSIRHVAVQLGGYAVVKHLSPPLYGQVDVWGEKPAYFSLLDGIKRQIDPNRILNPKRFVGGI